MRGTRVRAGRTAVLTGVLVVLMAAPFVLPILPGASTPFGAAIFLLAWPAKAHGYGERGYRTVFNCNADAGQTVFHIHLHLLAGRTMTWPPG